MALQGLEESGLGVLVAMSTGENQGVEMYWGLAPRAVQNFHYQLQQSIGVGTLQVLHYTALVVVATS